jgi:hypothetical protein
MPTVRVFVCEMRCIRCVNFCWLVGQRTGVFFADGKPAGCGRPQAYWHGVAKIEYVTRGQRSKRFHRIVFRFCRVCGFGILTSLVQSELVHFYVRRASRAEWPHPVADLDTTKQGFFYAASIVRCCVGMIPKITKIACVRSESDYTDNSNIENRM